MHHLLSESVIRVETGSADILTLPEVYAALSADRIVRFPALRPHQAPAWHAFLVQVAAMGCEVLELNQPPGDDPEAWAGVLRALTPDFPDDAPWHLISPPDQPALLQAPVPGGDLSAFKGRIDTPDALDLLVTSKNHDFKAERMSLAEPDDWLFALVSLQTQEGVMGAGKYGIARMNGGYGSRPSMGLAPASGQIGARVMRDVRVLLHNGNAMSDAAADMGMMQSAALGLLWLERWDGQTQITLDQLHPLFVEVCRRVRLIAAAGGNIRAIETGSAAARIAAKQQLGVLGDPWAPVELAEQPKLLSITSEGFSYRRISALLFGSENRNYKLPLLSRPAAHETSSQMRLVVSALARGQGKTEGFHCRELPIPPKVAAAISEEGERWRQLAERARQRVRLTGEISGKALRPALIVLLQKGPSEPEWKKPSNEPLAAPWLARFDGQVDAEFFGRLWKSLDQTEEEQELDWADVLRRLARGVFDQAAEAAPHGDERRIIAIARASNLLEGALHKQLPRAPRETENDAA